MWRAGGGGAAKSRLVKRGKRNEKKRHVTWCGKKRAALQPHSLRQEERAKNRFRFCLGVGIFMLVLSTNVNEFQRQHAKGDSQGGVLDKGNILLLQNM